MGAFLEWRSAAQRTGMEKTRSRANLPSKFGLIANARVQSFDKNAGCAELLDHFAGINTERDNHAGVDRFGHLVKRVETALTRLAGQSTLLHYTHQNIAEFWNTVTRPVSRNGPGLAMEEAERQVLAVEFGMTLLPDGDAAYREWRKIVVKHRVTGVQFHDARLAAVICMHGVRHILTFNAADFSRFDGLVAVHPESV